MNDVDIAYRLLPIAHCPLLIAYCLLPIDLLPICLHVLILQKNICFSLPIVPKPRDASSNPA